jgi:hypothetical protein
VRLRIHSLLRSQILTTWKFAFEELEKLKETNKVVSKHYMDSKFSIGFTLYNVTIYNHSFFSYISKASIHYITVACVSTK